MEDVFGAAEHVDTQCRERFGRMYGLLDCHRLEDAEAILGRHAEAEII